MMEVAKNDAEVYQLNRLTQNEGIFYGVKNLRTGTVHIRATGCLTLEDYDRVLHDAREETAYFGAWDFESLNHVLPYKDGIQYFLALRIPNTLTAKLVRKIHGFDES